MIRVVALALVLFGCASAPTLDEAGRGVTITSTDEVAACWRLGTVAANVGGNGQSYSRNRIQANDVARNKAGARGATHVVLDAPAKAGCPNCVMVSGEAYRCGGGASNQPPTGTGEERGACYPNRTCNGTLVCLSGLCVNPDPHAAAPQPVAEPLGDRCERDADPTACTTLGTALIARDDADDRARGRRHLESACASPITDACVTLAYDLSTNATTRAELERAVTMFDDACRAQSARACMFLGVMHETGKGTPKDLERARAAYELACSAGTAAACTRRDQLVR